MGELTASELAIVTKHGLQMAKHQAEFGRLGEPQTELQRKALLRANKELEAAR